MAEWTDYISMEFKQKLLSQQPEGINVYSKKLDCNLSMCPMPKRRGRGPASGPRHRLELAEWNMVDGRWRQ